MVAAEIEPLVHRRALAQMEQIRDAIHAERERRRLTYGQLAELAGVSTRAVRCAESTRGGGLNLGTALVLLIALGQRVVIEPDPDPVLPDFRPGH